MREEHATLTPPTGTLTLAEPTTLWGTIQGNVTVTEHGKLWARGLILGDVTILPGGRAHLFGTVSGSVHAHPKTKVILSGTVGQHAINHGGRLYIDKSATIEGHITTHAGDTRINGVKQQ